MPTKIAYSISASASGGRDGRSATADGRLDFKMTPPPELGGPKDGDGVNPEQLFAAGYAACFLGALKFYAGQKKVAVPADAKVTVTVGIGPREDLGFGLAVEIAVSLPGIDKEVAEDLVAGGHKVCPYSHLATNATEITPKLV